MKFALRLKKIKRTTKYIITQYLPEFKSQKVIDHWKEEKEQELFFKYQYLFFHSAFILRFVTRTGRLAGDYDHLWKRGIWLKHKGTEALIEAFPGEGSILVRIRGNSPFELLRMIHSEFVEIDKNSKNAKIVFGYSSMELIPYEEWQASKDKVRTANRQLRNKGDYDPFGKVINPDSEALKKLDLKSIIPPAPQRNPEESHQEETLSVFRTQLIESLRGKLATNFKQTIGVLKQCYSSIPDELILLEARYNTNSEDLLNGIILYEEYKSSLNRIQKSLIELIWKIDINKMNVEAVKRIIRH